MKAVIGKFGDIFKKSSREENKVQKNIFVEILKGAGFGVVFSIVAVLVFAALLKLFNFDDNVIMPVNQVIKVLSVFFGCFFVLRRQKKQGLVKGLLLGLVYVVLSFLVFSAMDGSFNLSITLVNDLFFMGIAGGVSGIILVNLGRRVIKKR
ncbi:MAG: TIGR04086 family membrane protein [Firmicutes bacterium]|nr:TIGR04086 family membrane protein [Bacillota bacterium]